jgi:hypothetical protein
MKNGFSTSYEPSSVTTTKNKVRQLNDENYYAWSREMKMVLMSKGLWISCVRQYVDEDDKEKEKRDSENLSYAQMVSHQKAIGIMGVNIAPKFLSLIEKCQFGYHAWENLEDHFIGQSFTTLLMLKCSFYSADLEEKESLLGFLDRMVTLQEKMDSLNDKVEDIEVCYKILSVVFKRYDAGAVLALNTKSLTLSSLRAQLTLEDKHQIIKQEYGVNHKSKSKVKKEHEEALMTNEDWYAAKCKRCGGRGHDQSRCRVGDDKAKAYKEYVERKRSTNYVDAGQPATSLFLL